MVVAAVMKYDQRKSKDKRIAKDTVSFRNEQGILLVVRKSLLSRSL